MHKKRRNKASIFLIMIVSTLFFLSACSVSMDSISAENESSQEETWDTDSSTAIEFGDSISIDGEGATVSDNTVTITDGGTYVLSGTLENGQVRVETADEIDVQLVLNGVSITNETGPAIYVVNANQTTITLAEGTDNTLSDGSEYVFENSEEDEPDATVFSHDDLVFNGEGNVTITAHYKDAIKGKDDVTITGGYYTISAVEDGIKGRDSVTITNGNFVIEAGKDGIHTTNDTDEGKGTILIEDGVFDIASDGDGIQAETDLQITGGYFNIITGGGSENAETREPVMDFPGNWGSEETDEENETSDSSSAKGLKAGTSMQVEGGTITVDSLDDAVHSDGTIHITGGEWTLSTGDDGIHADQSLSIDDGTIVIQESYEGLESLTVTINGGTIEVYATDDGLNASGGSTTNSENALFEMSDGVLVISADGDGIDSNGDIEMTGGLVIVNGPEDNGNGAFDYDGTFTLSGGTLIATGSAGMAMTPSIESTQSSLFTTNLSYESGTLLQITDSNQEVIFTFELSKNSQSLIFSSPDLTEGESYSLYADGEVDGSTAYGVIENAGFANGTLIEEVTATTEQTATGMMGSGGPPNSTFNEEGSEMPGGPPGSEGEEMPEFEEGEQPGRPGGTAPPGMSGEGTDEESEESSPMIPQTPPNNDSENDGS